MGKGNSAPERGLWLPNPRRVAAITGAVVLIVASPARRAAAQEDDRGENVPVLAVTLDQDASAEEVCAAVQGSPATLARLQRCLRPPQLRWQPW